MGKGHRRRRWVVAGIIAVAVVAGTLLHRGLATPEAPRVDPALERAVLPAVDRYLLTDPLGPLGSDDDADENPAPRGFCTEHVIEIRPAGDGLRVGLAAWCGHFARHGAGVTMLDGGIMAGALTVSPATAPARVSDVSWEPDGDSSSWAATQFSAGGAAEAERLLGDSTAYLTDPEAKARAAFGLPTR
ncbi:hypothetical protein ABZ883_14160 [Streptomyces sp. NPDC046977]|uniref:hypothetical protein n=1 Tax=Streptomyces sp. NPDC046977 TaxID=3154703 RepID=UPI003405CADA